MIPIMDTVFKSKRGTNETGVDLGINYSNDRYQYKKPLGSGASSKVWLAYDKQQHKDVAIKIYSAWDGSDSQSRYQHKLPRSLFVSRVACFVP